MLVCFVGALAFVGCYGVSPTYHESLCGDANAPNNFNVLGGCGQTTVAMVCADGVVNHLSGGCDNYFGPFGAPVVDGAVDFTTCTVTASCPCSSSAFDPSYTESFTVTWGTDPDHPTCALPTFSTGVRFFGNPSAGLIELCTGSLLCPDGGGADVNDASADATSSDAGDAGDASDAADAFD
jgi:hypothetical protein